MRAVICASEEKSWGWLGQVREREREPVPAQVAAARFAGDEGRAWVEGATKRKSEPPSKENCQVTNLPCSSCVPLKLSKS